MTHCIIAILIFLLDSHNTIQISSSSTYRFISTPLRFLAKFSLGALKDCLHDNGDCHDWWKCSLHHCTYWPFFVYHHSRIFATIPGSDTKQLFGHLLFYALANFFVKLFNSCCILWWNCWPLSCQSSRQWFGSRRGQQTRPFLWKGKAQNLKSTRFNEHSPARYLLRIRYTANVEDWAWAWTLNCFIFIFS